MSRFARVPAGLVVSVAIALAITLSGCGGGVNGVTGASLTGGVLSLPAQAVSITAATGQAAGRTVSTPAITVAVGQPFPLPVQLDDRSGVAGALLQLTYDPAALACTDAAGGDVVASASSPAFVKNIAPAQHTATVAVAAASASGSGRGTIATFSMKALSATASTASLNLTGILLDATGAIIGRIGPASSSPAQVSAQAATLVGDLMGTGLPNVGSAIKILRVIVGLDAQPPSAALPIWDCNGNGVIDVADAIKILRCVVGLDPWPIVVPTTADVTGIVQDVNSQSPLSGAIATIGTLNSPATGTNGRFTVNGVAKGSQSITITCPGYNKLVFLVTVTPGTFDVGIVNLVPSGGAGVGAVTGTVYQADGSTVVPGARVFVQTLSTLANASGNFTLTNVPVGRQLVMATFTDGGGATVNAWAFVTILAGQTVQGVRLVATDGPPPPPI